MIDNDLQIRRFLTRAGAVVFLLALLFSQYALAQDKLRVGVYLNPPLSYPGENGNPSGFVIDILDHIAHQEGWQLEYVSCTWDECNELLRLGEINILSPVSLSDARDRRLDFNRESL